MQQIAVDNFRVFNAATRFDLAPVTILTGRNNAGKSSLIKAILLLADFVEQDDHSVLRLDGPRARRHKINNFDNLKNWEDASGVVKLSYAVGDYCLEYEFRRHPEPVLAVLQRFRIVAAKLDESLELGLRDHLEGVYHLVVRQSLIDYIINEDAYLAAQSLQFLAEARKTQEQLAALEEEISKKQAQFAHNPELLKYQAVAAAFAQLNEKRTQLLERIEELRQAAESSRTRDKGITYSAEIPVGEVDLGATTLPRIIQHGLVAYVEADAARTTQYFKYRAEEERRTLVRFYQELQQLLRLPTAHLGPNRTYQSRLYFSQQSGSEITAIVEAFVHGGIRHGSIADRFLRQWLPRFNVGDAVNVTPVEGMAFKITIDVTGKHSSPVNLADLGFGAGQVLTVLLQIASVIQQQQDRAAAGKTREVSPVLLLIEEPEANLHPRLQSLLAVLFAEVTQQYRIRLLVETHSEYLIRKLQLLVASQPRADVGEHVLLYYMDQRSDEAGAEPARSQAVARRITILADGRLSETFGAGFFDEADENAMELYRLQKKAAKQLNV